MLAQPSSGLPEPGAAVPDLSASSDPAVLALSTSTAFKTYNDAVGDRPRATPCSRGWAHRSATAAIAGDGAPACGGDEF